VDSGLQQGAHGLERSGVGLPRKLSEWRNLDSNENVAFAVLTRTGFEEPLKYFCNLAVGEVVETLFYFG